MSARVTVPVSEFLADYLLVWYYAIQEGGCMVIDGP